MTADNGPSSIQNVALYTNLNGQERFVQDSNTYVIFEPDKPLEVANPDGLLSTANVITSQNGTKLDMVFNMTFAKPMAKSDMIIRVWDQNRASSDDRLPDALEVKGPLITLPNNTPQTLQPILKEKQFLIHKTKNRIIFHIGLKIMRLGGLAGKLGTLILLKEYNI